MNNFLARTAARDLALQSRAAHLNQLNQRITTATQAAAQPAK